MIFLFNTYHAVLLIKHQGAIFIAFKQRLPQPQILGDSVEDDRLQLFVISNEHHLLCVLEGNQRNEALRFHAHPTLIDNDLTDVCSGSQPRTGTRRTCAQNDVVLMQFVYACGLYQLLIVVDLFANRQNVIT